MKYIIVKDAAGELVCYGPDNGMYEPTLAEGQTRHVVDEVPPPSKKQRDAAKAEEDAATAARVGVRQKLKALGLTDAEVELLAAGR